MHAGAIGPTRSEPGRPKDSCGRKGTSNAAPKDAPSRGSDLLSPLGVRLRRRVQPPFPTRATGPLHSGALVVNGPGADGAGRCAGRFGTGGWGPRSGVADGPGRLRGAQWRADGPKRVNAGRSCGLGASRPRSGTPIGTGRVNAARSVADRRPRRFATAEWRADRDRTRQRRAFSGGPMA
jgi:hypothetical protein